VNRFTDLAERLDKGYICREKVDPLQTEIEASIPFIKLGSDLAIGFLTGDAFLIRTSALSIAIMFYLLGREEAKAEKMEELFSLRDER
jgi:hypothetical protein